LADRAGKTVVVIQARMGSSRLPGKVLMPVGGRPLLAYLIERVREAKRVDELIVATTTEPADAAIAAYCEAEGVRFVRGSEQDVLSRFVLATDATRAEVVVRVTADCPLLEPGLVDSAIAEFQDSREAPDYVSNMLEPTWPYGMAVEVLAAKSLRQAHAEARDPAEREHVTPFIYRRPERFKLRSLTMQPDLSAERWTVDTPEDFDLVSRILGELHPRNPRFRLRDVVALLDRHPDWRAINRHVEQKTVSHRIETV
jgi:spore coat polysaccharide biosynthesis protein SpsF